jgi:hypothetical protein
VAANALESLGEIVVALGQLPAQRPLDLKHAPNRSGSTASRAMSCQTTALCDHSISGGTVAAAGRTGTSDGATRSHATPTPSSNRLSAQPVGPASYATASPAGPPSRSISRRIAFAVFSTRMISGARPTAATSPPRPRACAHLTRPTDAHPRARTS